jgi:hypothetical protein
MKRRASIVLVLVAAAMAIAAPPLSAGTLKDLFTAATQSNQDYSMFKIDLELAQLKKNKGEIEAKVELDRVNAQYAYVSALAEYRKSVLAFYNEVIDAAFAVATAEADATAVGLNLENAKEDDKYAESRFRNGLISEEILKEIDIALKTVSANQEFTAWTLQDAKDNIRMVTGLAWEPKLLPDLPVFEAKATAEEWIAKDPALEKARLSEKIAALKIASLATNASVYDRKILETESLRAKVAAANAEGDSRRAWGGARGTGHHPPARLQIRTDEYALKKLTLDDALRQYEKGIISLNDKNLKAIAVLTAQKNLLAARKSYVKTIGAYLSAIGDSPLGF